MNNINTKFDDIELAIINFQNKFLPKDSKQRVLNKPIKIEIQDPDCTPLALVDLPGIIHYNKNQANCGQTDQDQIIQMIYNYIAPKNTIIVVCRTANSDTETQQALSFAQEYDPSGIRTLQIFTKGDNFSEIDNAKRVYDDIKSGMSNEKGSHIVACRIRGKPTSLEDELS